MTTFRFEEPLMRYYVVRHKLSQELLPADLRTASWWEPGRQTGEHIPRLFKNQKSARAFITSWARGVVEAVKGSSTAPFDQLRVIPRPDRDKYQLEVVPVFLTFGDPQ